MAVTLTHGDLELLGIGHEPWCPHGKTTAPASLQAACWCEYDHRAEQARQVVERVLNRENIRRQQHGGEA